MAATGQKKVLLCSLACGLLFAVANFLVAPLMSRGGPGDPGAVWVYLCMGAIGAEGGLHAIWCVLAPVRFAKRLAIGVGVGLVLYGAWALGHAASIAGRGSLHDRYWGYVLTGLLCLPLLSIAIQSPLWLARIWLGWRVGHRANPFRGSEVEAFRIRHLLGATAVVALALSAVRLSVPDDVPSKEPFLVGFAIAALVTAAVSLFTTLPAVAATLCARRLWLTLPVLLFLDVAALLGIVVILSAVFGEWPSVEILVGLAVVVGSFFACLTGVMLVVRGLGYRLAWGRRKTTLGDRNSAPPG